MNDTHALGSRLRDLSGDLQTAIADAIDRWSEEGKGQLRDAVGIDRGIAAEAFVAGAVVGAIIGALVALLLAPKSGSELRGELAERARQTNGMTREPAETPLR